MKEAGKVDSLNAEECLDNLKYTRDFGIYLDMLNALKDKYLIILCLKDTTDQKVSEELIGKIHSFGFAKYTADPGMKYVGISNHGSIICDVASPADRPPVYFEGTVEGAKLYFSFEGKEVEIRVNDEDQSMYDRGLNFVVFDCESMSTVEACCYDASVERPTFYHRNLNFNKQYVDSHIYMPEKYMDTVTLPMRRSYFSNRKLGVREVENGIFLTNKRVGEEVYGGVCDEEFNFIAGHQVFSPHDSYEDDPRHIRDSYEPPVGRIKYMNETVLYGGSMLDHPGHLITEGFADRVWWIAKHADSDLKIAVELFQWTDEYESLAMELFDAFGISNDRIILIKKPTKFKKIIIPDQSSFPVFFSFPYDFTAEFTQTFEYIKSRLTPGKDKKLYLTKSHTLKGNIIGEEFFIDFFRKKGFRIVVPEEYTIKEKAEMMYGADEIVTVDGTNEMFSIFCKPTVKVTILTRYFNFWNSPQQLVTESVGIKDFFMINASGNFLRNTIDTIRDFAWGISLLCVTKEFKKYVKDVYDEELDITPEESLKNNLYEFLAYLPEYYRSDLRWYNFSAKKITFLDILKSTSEVFLREEFSTGGFDLSTEKDKLTHEIKRLEKENAHFIKENEEYSEKVRLLSDKAKEFIDENAVLKRYIAQLEAEIRLLCDEKSVPASKPTETDQKNNAPEPENGQT